MPLPANSLGDSPLTDKATAQAAARADAFQRLLAWTLQQGLRSRAALGSALEMAARDARTPQQTRDAMMLASELLRAPAAHDAGPR